MKRRLERLSCHVGFLKSGLGSVVVRLIPAHDVFELGSGKIKRFDCYPEGSIILAQLGVLNNLGAALSH
jgi:hypothetical protein